MALQIFNIDPIVIDVGGVAKPLTTTIAYAASITLQADYNNVGRICIGGPNVTPLNGIQCAPGESAVIEFNKAAGFSDDFDLSSIYIVSSASGDSARVAYIKRG